MTKQKLFGITLIMIGLILAGFVLVRSTLYAPDTEITPPDNATSSLAVGTISGTNQTQIAKATQSQYPQSLVIPKIGVSAGVQYVGIKANGAMANPSNFTDVGWYKLGTVPGFPGSAVMAGHVDNALALSGVFKHLKDVAPGDDVYVVRKDGKRLHFVVDKVEYYPYKLAPAKEIFTSSDGKAHLNLISCAGTWIQAEKSYDKRIVVYTTLAE